MDLTMIFSALALALGAGWCSGINLYATVAVLGAMHRYTAYDLPPGLAVLGNEYVLLTALLLYLVEFVADKVPAVDTAWDAIHTFIRVPAGAVLAAQAFGPVPLEWQVVAGLVGGSLALGSHTVKATARLAAHGTGTSPVVSPVASVAEDVVVGGVMYLVVTHPVLALFVLALLLIGSYFLVRALWSLAVRAFRGLVNLRQRFAGGTDLPAAAP